MQIIKLKNLTIRNFKGISFFELKDLTDIVNIYAANGKGKTTLFDAVNYLLFGKNSEDKSDFNIRPLDENNNIVHKVDCEVSAVFVVNNMNICFKKVFREKWVTKRGEPQETFTGNETLYFCDDIPQSQSEFKAKVDSIVNESLFKLITSPAYFNKSLKWEERRRILSKIAGEVENTAILDQVMTTENKGYFTELINLLNSGKSTDDYKKKIAVDIKRIKDEVEKIPTRIDEVVRNTPQKLNFDEIRVRCISIQSKVDQIEKEISDSNIAYNRANEANYDIQKKINELNLELTRIEGKAKNDASREANERDSKQRNLRTKIASLKDDISFLEQSNSSDGAKKISITKEIDALREKWVVKDAETMPVIDTANFICSTCKRPFETDNIEAKKKEFTENFNKNKLLNLNSIKSDAESKKELILQLDVAINSRSVKISDFYAQIETFKTDSAFSNEPTCVPAIDLNSIPEYVQVSESVKALQTSIKPLERVNNDELKTQKANLFFELTSLNAALESEKAIKRASERVEELNAENRKLSQELATLQKTEFAIDSFDKAKIQLVESRVNSKFKLVKFKMFEKQINGGTNDVCISTVRGIPFSDLNTAAQIQAGLDIINTLSEFYGAFAPCFIDHRESVTDIPEMNCQIINLIVSPEHQELTIK